MSSKCPESLRCPGTEISNCPHHTGCALACCHNSLGAAETAEVVAAVAAAVGAVGAVGTDETRGSG